ELGMPLERRDRMSPRLAVPPGVELEAETLAQPTVALRPEIGARLGNCEVDVEENGAECHLLLVAGIDSFGLWKASRRQRAVPARSRRSGTAISGSCSRASLST